MDLNEAAALAEVAPGYLSDLERGEKRNPGLYVLERLSYVYGTSPGTLIESDPSRSSGSTGG
jgi:transcriptional regulator with XRE-family HTH domain